MDDFLYNLRNGNTKRYEGKRKIYSNYNKNYDRQRPRDNRSNFSQGLIHQELVPTFKKMMEEITENYKRIAVANERRALAHERQVEILESIASHLGIPNLPEKITPVETMVEENTDSLSASELDDVESNDSEPVTSLEFDKKKILDTILEMRKNKVSYGKIAQYLRSHGVPTFSGRGTWHGQTVSRLCD